MAQASQAESRPVFEHLVGLYKRVADIDKFGLLALNFSIRSGPHSGLHWVWIEPSLVRVRRSRNHSRQ
jgi:hypothetical protein